MRGCFLLKTRTLKPRRARTTSPAPHRLVRHLRSMLRLRGSVQRHAQGVSLLMSNMTVLAPLTPAGQLGPRLPPSTQPEATWLSAADNRRIAPGLAWQINLRALDTQPWSGVTCNSRHRAVRHGPGARSSAVRGGERTAMAAVGAAGGGAGAGLEWVVRRLWKGGERESTWAMLRSEEEATAAWPLFWGCI